MEHLSGKTAVVTGAASGIGRAMANRFARAGMNVVLTDIEGPVLDEAVAEVNAGAADGARAMGVIADVASLEEVQQLAARSISEFGSVQVLCNNAGVGGGSLSGSLGDVPLPDWEWVMGVNFWGVVNGHNAFLPHLLEQDEGHIVNTASMAGHMPGHSAYSASKWAVVGITEGLYGSLAQTGSNVGVSCLCPGWINTNIGSSARNRPEWAAPRALDEPDADSEARHQMVVDALASGLPAAGVADLVHDAIVDKSFWIFTHDDMVEMLTDRFAAVLDKRNPTPRVAFSPDG